MEWCPTGEIGHFPSVVGSLKLPVKRQPVRCSSCATSSAKAAYDMCRKFVGHRLLNGPRPLRGTSTLGSSPWEKFGCVSSVSFDSSIEHDL